MSPEELGLPPILPSREEIHDLCHTLHEEIIGGGGEEMADWLGDVLLNATISAMDDITAGHREVPLSTVIHKIFMAGLVCGIIAERHHLPTHL